MKTLLRPLMSALLLQAIVMLSFCTASYAQCTNTSQYPTGTIAINPTGLVTSISGCNFAGEYSVLSGAVAGQTIELTYSQPGGYITVRSGSSSGPVVASGNAPLSFSNSFTGDLFAHWNVDSSCGSNFSCNSTTVQCTSCGTPGCNNPTQYPSGSFAINTSGVLTFISTCNFGGEYTTITEAVSGQTLNFTYSQPGGFITVRSGTSAGPVVASGNSPLSFVNSYTGTLFAHWNTSSACGVNASCANTTVQCTSCMPTPPCNAPGTPVITNITTNSATVNFAPAAGAVNYDWTVGTGGSCPTGTGANTSATMLSLGGLIPNTTYRVCVRTSTCGGGTASSYVTSTFTTAALPNDACAEAQTVTCGSTVTGNTLGAASDAAAGSCGIGSGGAPGNGVWYKLTGNGAQATISLCGSSYDTKLHVYSGTCAGLSCLNSNDDHCGLQSQVVFNAAVGTDYYILVSGSGSANGAFSMSISCLCGPALGFPWTTSSIGGAGGSAIENVCDNTTDISSNGYSPSLSSDALYFAHQNLCGNQTITVKVNNISNSGFAGIMFRESTSAGSKMVAIKTQLNNFVHRESRSTTGGAKTFQQISSLGHSWLRLVRSGNTFTGFRSSNGISWNLAFTLSVTMNACLEVGLFTQSLNQSDVAMASFSNITGFPNAVPTLSSFGSNAVSDMTPMEITLYPNPAQSEINLQLATEFLGKDIIIRVSNQLGQTLITQRITGLKNLQETLPLHSLSSGLFILSVQTEGQELISKKFVVGNNRP